MSVAEPGDPPFARVGIAGLGLIGGSIALAARRAWPGIELAGVDDDAVTEEALGRGIIDHVRRSADEFSECQLVVLASPIPAILSTLPTLTKRHGVITDVGSTKRRIMAAAGEARLPEFVGGHPMAGASRGGLAHASETLFEGRPWVLVPGGASAASLARLEAFVGGLGARARVMSAEDHDRAVAYVSHLPQLVAQALAVAAESGVGAGGLSVAGPGFHDMTRLAGSPFDVWQGILSTNADFVSEALEAFAAAVPRLGDLADAAALDRRFAAAQEALRHLRTAASK